MRLWTYILPVGIWLWIVRRNCERISVGNLLEGSDAGRIVVIYKKLKD